MISGLIVFGTTVAILGYSLLYWLKPEWRQSVEQPKHIFQRQLEAYDNKQETDESDT